MKKNDLLLLAVVLLLAGALLAGYHLLYHQTGAYVTISVDGDVIETLPLNQDTTLHIKGADHTGSNTLTIKDGYANMTDADCPDKLCVHQKKIHNQGESLVCLPHKVIVTVHSRQKSKLDDVSY